MKIVSPLDVIQCDFAMTLDHVQRDFEQERLPLDVIHCDLGQLKLHTSSSKENVLFFNVA